MRNIKKMLVAICVFALLAVGCIFAAIAEEASNVGTVAELNELIAEVENGDTAPAKYSAMLKVSEYLSTKKISASEEGYDEAIKAAHKASVTAAASYFDTLTVDNLTANAAYEGMVRANELLALFELSEDTEGLADAKVKNDAALVKAVEALVDALDKDIETTLHTAKNKVAINKVNRVLAESTLYGDATALDEVLVTFEELVAAHERATLQNLVILDEKNLISNYDLPIYLDEDWQSKTVGLSSVNIGSGWSVEAKGSTNDIGILEEADGNKYYIHRYNDPRKLGSYIQYALKGVDSTNGLVFTFDVTTFDELPTQGVFIETGSVAGTYFPEHYFVMKANGDICSNNGSTVVFPNAIVKGQWLNVMIVFDYSDFTYSLYIEGEYITKYSAIKADQERFSHEKVAFRISGHATDKGEISYDNISIYAGNSFRFHDKLEKMTDAEKFLYYVDYLSDEEREISGRSKAYDLAEKFISKYWTVTDEETGAGEYTDLAKESEELMAAVDAFLNFDLDILMADIMDKNLDKYVELVKDLNSVARNMNSASTRKQKIEAINVFIGDIKDLIDRSADKNGNGTPDYTEYNLIFNQISREANYDLNAPDFIRHINRFQTATTLAAKERYYERAKKLVEGDGIDIALIRDTTNPYRNNFKELIAAYAIYENFDSIIYELTKENNSTKILHCVDKIDEFKTEEEWEENREIMEKYLYIIKPIVLDTDENGELLYDPTYEGIGDAIEFFNASYGYFYGILQEEHIAYLNDILDKVNATEAYIEKMGMISVIDRYLASNDIDYSNAEILDIMNNLDTCKAELLLREEDYAKILVQNATYFINSVERMRTAATYAEQKKYFEEAAALYFYLDVSVEGAARAVEIYDEYKIKLQNIEESSLKFIEAVAIYNACETDDDKYAALVECYYNAQFVEMSYEGAEEAMAEYQAAYEAYMNYVNGVNEDIVESGNVTGSFASASGIVTVIAVIIKKIFGI